MEPSREPLQSQTSVQNILYTRSQLNPSLIVRKYFPHQARETIQLEEKKKKKEVHCEPELGADGTGDRSRSRPDSSATVRDHIADLTDASTGLTLFKMSGYLLSIVLESICFTN
jgi:hypothetical protein